MTNEILPWFLFLPLNLQTPSQVCRYKIILKTLTQDALLHGKGIYFHKITRVIFFMTKGNVIIRSIHGHM